MTAQAMEYIFKRFYFQALGKSSIPQNTFLYTSVLSYYKLTHHSASGSNSPIPHSPFQYFDKSTVYRTYNSEVKTSKTISIIHQKTSSPITIKPTFSSLFIIKVNPEIPIKWKPIHSAIKNYRQQYFMMEIYCAKLIYIFQSIKPCRRAPQRSTSFLCIQYIVYENRTCSCSRMAAKQLYFISHPQSINFSFDTSKYLYFLLFSHKFLYSGCLRKQQQQQEQKSIR